MDNGVLFHEWLDPRNVHHACWEQECVHFPPLDHCHDEPKHQIGVSSQICK